MKTKRNHGPCQPADDQQHHSKLDRSRTSDCPEDRCMWQQAWQKGYERMDTRWMRKHGEMTKDERQSGVSTWRKSSSIDPEAEL